MRRDAFVQTLVLGRVDAIDPGAEHGNRFSFRVERAEMRGRIHAARQPTHDDDPRAAQITGDLIRDLDPFPRRSPGADHGNRGGLEKGPISVNPETVRWVGDLPQQWRELGSVEIDAVHAYEK